MPYFEDKNTSDPYRSQSPSEIAASVTSMLFGPLFVGLNVVTVMRVIDSTSINLGVLVGTIILCVVTFVAFLATKPDLKKYFSMIGLGFAPYGLATVIALFYALTANSRWELVIGGALMTMAYFVIFYAGHRMKAKPTAPPLPRV